MGLKKVGNIRTGTQGGSASAPSGMRKVGNIRTGVMLPKPKVPVQNTENYKRAVADADKYRQEAEQANSFKGMAANALKAAPQALADVLIGTPAKFAVSAYEAPKLAVDNLSGVKPGYTNKTYKIPGLSPFKSFQSDFGDVEKDVIEGKRGLASAAWELAKIPLAGAETLGIGKGLGKAAGAARVGDAKGAAMNVADAFLPTTRGLSAPDKPFITTEEKLRGELADLQTQRMRAALAVDRPRAQGYQSGIKAEIKPSGESISTPLFPEYAPNQVSFKGETTTPKFNYKKFIEQNLGIRDKKNIDGGLNKQISEIEGRLSQPGLLAVQDLPPSMGVNTPRVFSAPRKLITSGGTTLKKSGLGGKELERAIRKQQVEGDLLTGQYNSRISEALQGLSKEERMNVTDVLEGTDKPFNEKVAAASQKMRAFYDDVAREAQKQELQVKLPNGKSVPFSPRENYAPHIYDINNLQKAQNKEKAIQHLVSTGQARNKAEAERLFNDFILKNRERYHGNLERPRMVDFGDLYEKDADTAARKYAQSAARRLTQVNNFGKKDEIAAALIDKIANEGGDYTDAQKVFDSIYKGDARNKTIDSFLKFNTLTKLSLSWLSNITQSVNTATKGGVGNTAKAIVQSFTKPGREIAELAGVYSDPIIMQETGINMGKLLNVTMKPFQWVERFNRRVAANAGANFAKELARTLEKNPDSAFALRQLSSLGISPDKVFKGTLSGEDILKAANEFTKKTQFVSDALNVPTAWKTPTGKLLTQFKNFSFMQTKFIRDEIAKEAMKGNLKPLVTFLTLAPVASYASQWTRNQINAVDPNNEKANPSFRKLDLYRKAIGDIPTDIVSQLQFAYEKSQSPYTTPLTNVKNFSSPITGPTGSDVMALMSALEQQGNIEEQNRNWYAEHPAAQKDPYLDLKRFGAGKIPFVGRRIVNSQLAYGPTDAKKAEELAKEGFRTGDMSKVKDAVALDPYINRQDTMKKLMKEAQIEKMSQADQELYKQIQEMKKRPVKPFFTP